MPDPVVTMLTMDDCFEHMKKNGASLGDVLQKSMTIEEALMAMDVADQKGKRQEMRAMATYAAARVAPYDTATIMTLYRFGEYDSGVMNAVAGIITKRSDDIFDDTWKEDMTVDAHVRDWVRELPLEMFEHGLLSPAVLPREIKGRLLRAWGEDVDPDVIADLLHTYANPRSMLGAFVVSVLRPSTRVRTRRHRAREVWIVSPSTGVIGVGFIGGLRVYVTWSSPRFDSPVRNARLRLPELRPGVAQVTWSLGTLPSVDMTETLTVSSDAETRLIVSIVDRL
jgi:hypothetical protein